MSKIKTIWNVTVKVAQVIAVVAPFVKDLIEDLGKSKK